TDSALKKQMDQASWQAESLLVQTEMKVDQDEQLWKKEEEKSEAELASLRALEAEAQRALAQCRLEAHKVDAPLDDAIKQRVAGDRLAVLAESREQCVSLLQQLKTVTKSRVMDDLIPWLFIPGLAAAAAAVGWTVPPDNHTKIVAAAGAAVGALVVGVAGWLFYRSRRRARMR